MGLLLLLCEARPRVLGGREVRKLGVVLREGVPVRQDVGASAIAVYGFVGPAVHCAPYILLFVRLV